MMKQPLTTITDTYTPSSPRIPFKEMEDELKRYLEFEEIFISDKKFFRVQYIFISTTIIYRHVLYHKRNKCQTLRKNVDSLDSTCSNF